MSDIGIFIAGAGVTLITLAGVLIIGLAEAEDPVHSRPEDLQPFERDLVERPDLEDAGRAAGSRE